jgi:hypothetical protein
MSPTHGRVDSWRPLLCGLKIHKGSESQELGRSFFIIKLTAYGRNQVGKYDIPKVGGGLEELAGVRKKHSKI